MNRRDTIIIAVLINSGLLAILFMMAIHPNADLPFDQPSSTMALNQPHVEELQLASTAPVTYVQPILNDDVENAIKAFVSQDNPSSSSFHSDVALLDSTPSTQAPSVPTSNKDEYTEVKVKRGDFLERIARSNGTTVKAIMQANGLANERLSVGQILRVPVTQKATESKTVAEAPKKAPETRPADASTEFYVVQRGDNPWNIAKKFQVRFEDLLILNNLDEEKARNLKVGDKLRVR